MPNLTHRAKITRIVSIIDRADGNSDMIMRQLGEPVVVIKDLAEAILALYDRIENLGPQTKITAGREDKE